MHRGGMRSSPSGAPLQALAFTSGRIASIFKEGRLPGMDLSCVNCHNPLEMRGMHAMETYNDETYLQWRLYCNLFQ